MTTSTDIKLIKNSDGVFDIDYDSKGQLVIDNGYSTSLIITFGTDTRALSNQVKNSENRRGWWGNAFNLNNQQDIGSLLWILNTRPVLLSNLAEGKALLRQAFNWLVEQKRATRIDVLGEILPEGYKYTINILNGNDIIESKTFELWQATNGN